MIPLVAASGKGRGQAESYFERDVEMWLNKGLSRRFKVSWKGAP